VSAAAAVASVALLAGCQAGPASIRDGSYRLYATSESTQVDSAAATLEITGPDVVLVQDDVEWHTSLGEPAQRRVVCPPGGRGTPVAIEGTARVGNLTFTSPALIGDCRRSSPARVTLVDLDSVDTGMRFPFTRWAEFCDVADPDCPVSVAP
jgi:hypothetical protein